MTTVAQTKVQQQIRFMTVAYAMGEEDGLAGESEFTGYDYFVGAKLADYLAGHAAGKAVLDSLKATVLDEVRRTLQPQADTRLWGGDPTFAKWQDDGAPLAGADWSGSFEGVYGSGDYDE
jgi:hypothetical protein